MCYRLEFRGSDGKARNRISTCRLILNIVGVLLVLIFGAIAAVFATYHAQWFPQFETGDDQAHYALTNSATFKERAFVFNLTAETRDQCDNGANLMLGRPVFKCGPGASAMCIYLDYLCDGTPQCMNELDELGDMCTPFCDRAVQRDLRFKCEKCENSTVCMNSKVKCDGMVQCRGEDAAVNDEAQCEGTYMNDMKKVCGNGNDWVCANLQMCIRKADVKNGFKDCADGSDE